MSKIICLLNEEAATEKVKSEVICLMEIIVRASSADDLTNFILNLKMFEQLNKFMEKKIDSESMQKYLNLIDAIFTTLKADQNLGNFRR